MASPQSLIPTQQDANNSLSDTSIVPNGANTGAASNGTPKCSCFPNMYLATANMNAPVLPGFPYAVQPVKQAIHTCNDIIFCEQCPMSASTARQNVLWVHTLLNSIAVTFDVLLRDINKEAARATANGEKKTFRMGDSNPANRHLHTGTLDCPMGIDIDLEAEEWRKIAHRSVKAEVYDRGTEKLTLEKLCTSVENRQKAWHQFPPPSLSEMYVQLENHGRETCGDPAAAFTCLSLTQQIRVQIKNLPD